MTDEFQPIRTQQQTILDFVHTMAASSVSAMEREFMKMSPTEFFDKMTEVVEEESISRRFGNIRSSVYSLLPLSVY
jgi:hypothetical protein